MDPNPYLAAAFEAIEGTDLNGADPEVPSNLVTSLSFITSRIISEKKPEACYGEDLIQAAASAVSRDFQESLRRLKAAYGKEFNSVHWSKDVRDARNAMAVALPSKLIQTENGAARPILANALIQLRGSELRVAFDSFATQVVIQGRSPWGSEGKWRDADDSRATDYLQHRGVYVSTPIANEAVSMLAHENTIHPVRDWLADSKWDGEPRLDNWMEIYLGATPTPYLTSVSAKWMISAVARVMRPGCKADYMIVLEGPQRQGKSRALRGLTNGHLDGDTGVQWFRDSPPEIDKDDIGLYMQGVWVIEIAELEAVRGKQWTKVKSFVSSQVDTFRRKFGRNIQDYPRQCVFAGSTNEDHWGGDPTGLTRFWPVHGSKIDVDGILRVRDQLWAEARFRYDEGETWWLDATTEELARAEQAERQPDDAWTERVSKAVGLMLVSDVSISEVLDKMGLAIERQGHGEAMRTARSLHALGWERYRPARSGARVWRYRL